MVVEWYIIVVVEWYNDDQVANVLVVVITV